MNDRPPSQPKDILVQEPYSSFLANCRSKNTQDSYLQDLRVLERFLVEQSLSDPTQAKPSDLVRFAAHLTKPGTTPMGKPRKPYSTRTIKRILAAVRSFYQYLAAIQSLQTDPTVVFKTLPIRTPQRNPRPLGAFERKTLLQNLRTSEPRDLRISVVVRLGYECGLRVSEICTLRTADLDLRGLTLIVVGKGDKQRSIPMTQELASLLERLLDLQSEFSKGTNSPFLFPGPRDPQKPMNPQHLEVWVKKAAQWADLPNALGMTVHVLRHTFGTQLAESGASVYEIRDLMGHSSIVVSENYVKLASESARGAHRRAFGTGSKVSRLRIPGAVDFISLLRRFRRVQRKSE